MSAFSRKIADKLSIRIITSLFYIKSYPEIIPILLMTIGFGIIGFIDDYLIIYKHNNIVIIFRYTR